MTKEIAMLVEPVGPVPDLHTRSQHDDPMISVRGDAPGDVFDNGNLPVSRGGC